VRVLACLTSSLALAASLSWAAPAQASGRHFSAARVGELRASLRHELPQPGDQLTAFELDAWTLADTRIKALDRAQVEPAIVQALKFEWLVWRDRVTDILLQAPADDTLDARRIEAIEQMASRPSAGSLRRLHRRLDDRHEPALAHLAAHFGHTSQAHSWGRSDELDALAGPSRKIDIEPSAPSKWPLQRWAKKEVFGEYAFTERGVNYRGLELQSGDVFLLHMHEHSDGMYTSYADPAQLFPHFGLFVVLELDGKRLPAVLEIHRMGLRAIPLSAYLQPSYSDYVEVYRLDDEAKPEGFEARLSVAAIVAATEPHAYGLDPAQSLDSDRHYLTCGQVGSMLFERSGVDPWRASSAPTSGAASNLAKLDLELGPYLTPTDYVYHPSEPDNALHFVGLVDNGATTSMLARHLIITKVGEWMGTRSLDPELLGRDYKLKHWAMQHWEARDRLGLALVKLFGFTPDNFPGGPAKLMAAIDSLEHGVVNAVELAGEELAKPGALDRSLQAAHRDGGFDYEVWIADKELDAMAQRVGREFLRYFRDEPPA
jgi:hypothetical protein